jgi:hypothetical protein
VAVVVGRVVCRKAAQAPSYCTRNQQLSLWLERHAPSHYAVSRCHPTHASHPPARPPPRDAQTARAALERQLEALFTALGTGTATSPAAGLGASLPASPGGVLGRGGSRALHAAKVYAALEEPTWGEKVAAWTLGAGGRGARGHGGLADTAAGWAEAGHDALLGSHGARRGGMLSRFKEAVTGG